MLTQYCRLVLSLDKIYDNKNITFLYKEGLNYIKNIPDKLIMIYLTKIIMILKENDIDNDKEVIYKLILLLIDNLQIKEIDASLDKWIPIFLWEILQKFESRKNILILKIIDKLNKLKLNIIKLNYYPRILSWVFRILNENNSKNIINYSFKILNFYWSNDNFVNLSAIKINENFNKLIINISNIKEINLIIYEQNIIKLLKLKINLLDEILQKYLVVILKSKSVSNNFLKIFDKKITLKYYYPIYLNEFFKLNFKQFITENNTLKKLDFWKIISLTNINEDNYINNMMTGSNTFLYELIKWLKFNFSKFKLYELNINFIQNNIDFRNFLNNSLDYDYTNLLLFIRNLDGSNINLIYEKINNYYKELVYFLEFSNNEYILDNFENDFKMFKDKEEFIYFNMMILLFSLFIILVKNCKKNDNLLENLLLINYEKLLISLGIKQSILYTNMVNFFNITKYFVIFKLKNQNDEVIIELLKCSADNKFLTGLVLRNMDEKLFLICINNLVKYENNLKILRSILEYLELKSIKNTEIILNLINWLLINLKRKNNIDYWVDSVEYLFNILINNNDFSYTNIIREIILILKEKLFIISNFNNCFDFLRIFTSSIVLLNKKKLNEQTSSFIIKNHDNSKIVDALGFILYEIFPNFNDFILEYINNYYSNQSAENRRILSKKHEKFKFWFVSQSNDYYSFPKVYLIILDFLKFFDEVEKVDSSISDFYLNSKNLNLYKLILKDMS